MRIFDSDDDDDDESSTAVQIGIRSGDESNLVQKGCDGHTDFLSTDVDGTDLGQLKSHVSNDTGRNYDSDELDDNSQSENPPNYHDIEERSTDRNIDLSDLPKKSLESTLDVKAISLSQVKNVTKNENFAIRSETQRMVREAAIKLPYHTAKQRSLQEFLSRKKHTALPLDQLRCTSSKMIEKWTQIDESTKEAVEFFKSDSEEEEEEDSDCKMEDSNAEFVKVDLNDVASNVNVSMVINEGKLNTDMSLNEPLVDPNASECEIGSDANNLGDELNCRNAKERTPDPIEKTGKWLEDISRYDKLNALKKRLNLSPSILNATPKLSSDADDFVKLDPHDESSLKPGAQRLMDRLFNSHQPTKENHCSLTTSAPVRNENGDIIEIITEEIDVKTTSSNDLFGFGNKKVNLQALRGEILKDIELKWKEGYTKRTAESKDSVKEDYEASIKGEEADDEMVDSSSDESESEPEENDIDISDRPRKHCTFGDSEAEESSCDEESNEQNDEEKSDTCEQMVNDIPLEECDGLEESLLPAFQPGGGLLLGGSVLTQQTQKLPLRPISPTSSPLVSPVRQSSIPDNSCTETIISDKGSGISSPSANRLSNLHNTLPTDEPPAETNVKELIPEEEIADDPFLFVSGEFPVSTAHNVENTPTCNTQNKRSRILQLEDSEDSQSTNVENDEVMSIKGTLEDLNDDETARDIKTNRRKQLVFSDDESEKPDDEEEEVDLDSVKLKESEAAEESEIDDENSRGPIEYDSEENEILPLKATEYFENEAELSESEWSGDEDERDLDKLEVEAGDEDVLDEEQVASQLGRIHMRRVLDQDARDVRILQEILLEDGDLHLDGKKRERKFRWKNLTGFDRSDGRQLRSDSESDTEQEGALARRRHERVQLIQQLEQEGKKLLDDEEKEDDPFMHIGKRLFQRITMKSANKKENGPPTNLPRNSFLSRDPGFLSRLVRSSNCVKDAPLGPSHSRNFVFSSKSPEKTEKKDDANNSKRKAASSSASSTKRIKVTPVLRIGTSVLENLD